MNNHPGLLLDLDNTLYDYHPPHAAAQAAALGYLSRALGADPATVEAAFVHARVQIHRELAHTASSHNRLLYFQRTLERLGWAGYRDAWQASEIYWAVFFEHMRLRPGVRRFLDSVKGRAICLVTDLTAHIQYRKLLHLDLLSYFTHLVTSEETGREKPHPYIFLSALHKMGLGPDDVCMIGDNFDKDIMGATALGIPAIWLYSETDRAHLPATVRTVSSFDQLIGRI
ncbi:MAG: HAD family hydrolase [Deltaproteobacteria bacterium]|nr:HAD family hydrolase [Deltaproteobacteria bacterium]MBF0524704.1 HAD family hydrolase [Deltaproteobacteria bacterium]